MTDPDAHPPAGAAGGPDSTDGTERWLRPLMWSAAAVFAAAFLAFMARGADGPPDPYFASAGEPSAVAGFEEIALRIHGYDGAVRDFCVLLAADDASRSQGMRGRSDFAGYDGLLFAHDEVVNPSFTMEGVPIPLSAGFFDATGTFAGAIGMEPCAAGAGCPAYAPPAPFRWALEVPEGTLPALGVGDGARVEPGGPCPRR